MNDNSNNAYCLICGNKGTALYNNISDYIYNTPGQWNFLLCSNDKCGFIWLSPKPNSKTILKAYSSYYTHEKVKNKSSLSIWFKLMYNSFLFFTGLHTNRKNIQYMYLKKIQPGKLLDVGCGNGQFLLRMQSIGWDVTGQEIDQEAISTFNTKKIKIFQKPLNEIDESYNSYDAITMHHVLEHLNDPLESIAKCWSLLKKGGRLIIVTPNALSYGHKHFKSFWRGLEPPRHFFIYTPYSLDTIAKRTGFNNCISFTTAANSQGIGFSSYYMRKMKKNGSSNVKNIENTAKIHSIFFQIRASIIHIFKKTSGEECVLIASK